MKKLLLTIVKKRLAIKGHYYNLTVATFCERCITATQALDDYSFKLFIRNNINQIKTVALPSHRGLADRLESLILKEKL